MSEKKETPILKAEHLTKMFPVKKRKLIEKQKYVHAAEDVSFEVYPGEVLGIVGESGSGKSTLARTILALTPSTSGQVFYQGEDITDFKVSAGEKRRLRSEIQMIFQDPYASLNPKIKIGNAIAEPILFTDTGHFADDIVNVQHHLHHTDLLIIDSFIKLCLDFRLTYMINPESQRDSCQRTCKSGVTVRHGLGCQTGTLALGSTQQNHNVFCSVLLHELLDSLLILQIHSTCGRSDEALGRGEHDFGASALGTGRNGHTGDTVTVTDDDGLSALENTHFYFPPSFQISIPCPWGGNTKE